jgi:hypothetical protein
MRQALRKPQRYGLSRSTTLWAPIKGWRSDEGAAKEQPGAALKLINWIPEPDAVRLRRGFSSHATGMTYEVETLMVYTSATDSAMFAGVDDKIYDVSAAGAAVSSLTGMTNGRYSWTNMSTTGDQYLVIANGEDDVRHWNGSAWSTPSITGVNSNELNFVWQHKNRLWFLANGSMAAYYLNLDSIAGAATDFDIGALFNRGGSLIAGATWSVDAGDGMDDLNVLVTSEGEAAIYSMSDPGDPDTLLLKGIYYIGKPIGNRCLFKLGGDLLAITRAGVVPFSKVITAGNERLEEAALTAPIRRDYADTSKLYGSLDGWQIITHPRSNLMILNVPILERVESQQFVMNILTGAWCRFTNIDALSWCLFDEDIYFGGASGVVYKAETGSEDDGDAISAEMILSFSQLGATARQKHIKLVRPNTESNIQSRGTVTILADYYNALGTDISGDVNDTGVALWDDALWDVDVWPGSNVIRQWRGGGNIGTAMAVQFSITATTTTPEADLDYRVISFDVVYEVGGIL